MTYVQSDYTQNIGNGSTTVADGGSLLVAFSNLLKKLGYDITPDRLNNLFTNRGVYYNDNQLTWNSLSAYDQCIGINDVQKKDDGFTIGKFVSDDGLVTFHLIADGDDLSHLAEYVSYRKYEPMPVDTVIEAPKATPTLDDPIEAPVIMSEQPEVVEPENSTDTDDEVSIPVRVIPPDPNKWQQTYKPYLGPIERIALSDTIVADLSGKAEVKQLPKDMHVLIAGEFEKDGDRYYRTLKSVKEDVWYGVPLDKLERVNEEEDRIDDLLAELSDTSWNDDGKEGLTLDTRAKAIKVGATIEGKANHLKNKLFRKNK